MNFTQPEAVKIIKNMISKPSEVTPELFNKFLLSKFDKMKKLFLERTDKDFISLDKIDNSRQEVYVIGMVREIRTEEQKLTIEIEDITKSMPVIFNNYQPKTPLEEDDVIAVGGTGAKDVIFGKEIFYPDVPLREPNKGTGKVCIISDLHLDEAPIGRLINFFKWFDKDDAKYLLVAGDLKDLRKFSELVMQYIPNKNVFVIPGNVDTSEYPGMPMDIKGDSLISLSNPSMIDINGIKILLCHDFNIKYLKKRYIGKSKLVLESDYLALDELPDIVACGHTHEPEISNYKSITIANPGSLLADFKPVLIDLATREAKHMSFEEEKQ
jgi:DNA polymerase II small subunit